MKYPDMNQYITVLFSLLTEFFAAQPPRRARGSPRQYTDASLLVFHAAMALKGIPALRAQQHWLVQHPRMLQRCRWFPACPSHVTLSRRYAALGPLLREFTEFVARRPATVALGFCAEVVYTDKSLFTACGPVWHQRDRRRGHVPAGLRHVDKTAAWSYSKYHGWVHGYGLHLTCTRAGFLVLFDVLPANVNERKALDMQCPCLVKAGVRCIVADSGYRDKVRAAVYAMDGVLLLTPRTASAQAQGVLGAACGVTARQVAAWQASRKTAIEPVFDLLSRLLSTRGLHKPLPVRGIGYVLTFLGLGVLLLQVAMLMNVRHGLPMRAVKHIQTVFR